MKWWMFHRRCVSSLSRCELVKYLPIRRRRYIGFSRLTHRSKAKHRWRPPEPRKVTRRRTTFLRVLNMACLVDARVPAVSRELSSLRRGRSATSGRPLELEGNESAVYERESLSFDSRGIGTSFGYSAGQIH